MKPIGLIGIAMIALSVIGLAVSIPAMGKRLQSRPELRDRPVVWFQEPLIDENLLVNGEPLNFNVIDNADVEGGRALRITWRSQTADLPILGVDDPRLPGLMRFEDWLAVLPMLEGRGSRQQDVIDQLEAGEATPRLIIAARLPAEGLDPGSWGLVQRQNYRYRFLELNEAPADPPIVESQRTYRELEAIFAPGPHSPVIEMTKAEKDLIYWQHAAMQRVTPAQLYRAKDKQVQSAMLSMGWTWPVAGFSIIGLAAGVFMIAASRIER